MASSIGPPPTKRQIAKAAGCGISALVLVLCLGWFGLRMIFGEPLWKTTIGEVEFDGGMELCLGTAHDGDISYDYFARVRGASSDFDRWTRVGSHLDHFESCETAVTSDNRFACIACEDAELMVIFDSKEQELWWRGHDQWESDSKFVGAWRQLRSINSRLPEPPF